jgi:hypothetical protein
METTKFSPDHEMFVQIFQLSCSLENKIYLRVYRKIMRVQCGMIFYHVLLMCVRSILRFAEVVYSSVEI